MLSIFSYIYALYVSVLWDFPGGSVVKNPPANSGDTGAVSGLGRSPGGGNGNPLQHCCLENPIDRGAWWATVHGITKRLPRLSGCLCRSQVKDKENAE